MATSHKPTQSKFLAYLEQRRSLTANTAGNARNDSGSESAIPLARASTATPVLIPPPAEPVIQSQSPEDKEEDKEDDTTFTTSTARSNTIASDSVKPLLTIDTGKTTGSPTDVSASQSPVLSVPQSPIWALSSWNSRSIDASPRIPTPMTFTVPVTPSKVPLSQPADESGFAFTASSAYHTATITVQRHTGLPSLGRYRWYRKPHTGRSSLQWTELHESDELNDGSGYLGVSHYQCSIADFDCLVGCQYYVPNKLQCSEIIAFDAVVTPDPLSLHSASLIVNNDRGARFAVKEVVSNQPIQLKVRNHELSLSLLSSLSSLTHLNGKTVTLTKNDNDLRMVLSISDAAVFTLKSARQFLNLTVKSDVRTKEMLAIVLRSILCQPFLTITSNAEDYYHQQQEEEEEGKQSQPVPPAAVTIPDTVPMYDKTPNLLRVNLSRYEYSEDDLYETPQMIRTASSTASDNSIGSQSLPPSPHTDTSRTNTDTDNETETNSSKPAAAPVALPVSTVIAREFEQFRQKYREDKTNWEFNYQLLQTQYEELKLENDKRKKELNARENDCIELRQSLERCSREVVALNTIKNDNLQHIEILEQHLQQALNTSITLTDYDRQSFVLSLSELSNSKEIKRLKRKVNELVNELEVEHQEKLRQAREVMVRDQQLAALVTVQAANIELRKQVIKARNRIKKLEQFEVEYRERSFLERQLRQSRSLCDEKEKERSVLFVELQELKYKHGEEHHQLMELREATTSRALQYNELVIERDRLMRQLIAQQADHDQLIAEQSELANENQSLKSLTGQPMAGTPVLLAEPRPRRRSESVLVEYYQMEAANPVSGGVTDVDTDSQLLKRSTSTPSKLRIVSESLLESARVTVKSAVSALDVLTPHSAASTSTSTNTDNHTQTKIRKSPRKSPCHRHSVSDIHNIRTKSRSVSLMQSGPVRAVHRLSHTYSHSADQSRPRTLASILTSQQRQSPRSPALKVRFNDKNLTTINYLPHRSSLSDSGGSSGGSTPRTLLDTRDGISGTFFFS